MPERFKGRGGSSHDWLVRQMNDPYVQKARMENFRARSAFKLLEIDDKNKLLHPGLVVVECGASPGAWTQVSVQRINANGSGGRKKVGTHIAVDLMPMHPVDGAYVVAPADFTQVKTQQRILELLAGRQVDVILSDMAPKATGVRQLDQDGILELARAVAEFATRVSAPAGSLLVKLWAGGGVASLEKQLLGAYSSVKIVKPQSSRQESAELFLLARHFRGPPSS